LEPKKSKISTEPTSLKNISQMKNLNPQKTRDPLQAPVNPKRRKLKPRLVIKVLQFQAELL
jgi:hypothetical protein